MSPRYASADRVGRGELLDFARPRHRMVLITFRADGSVQSSPVSGGVVDQGKCLLRIIPTRWGPVATGGFPPPRKAGQDSTA